MNIAGNDIIIKNLIVCLTLSSISTYALATFAITEKRPEQRQKQN